MKLVSHKFRGVAPDSNTEILILGTFAPEVEEDTDFFYGRPKNFLWHLLPLCWDTDSLKESPLADKKLFMQKHKIGFADLIDTLEVPEGEEANTDDTFVDSHVLQWNDIISLINNLPALKAVYFTRKTFNGIPNMKTQLSSIAAHCRQKNIRMCKLETPARHFSVEKQQQWVDTIILEKTCLRV
jgi:G:T/U-mismatch repair DNA glycosylase